MWLSLLLPVGYSVESREKMQPGHWSFQSIPEGLRRARRGEKLGEGTQCALSCTQSNSGAVSPRCGSWGWPAQPWLHCKTSQRSALTRLTGRVPRVTHYLGIDTLKYLPIEILPPLSHMASGLVGGCKSLLCHGAPPKVKESLSWPCWTFPCGSAIGCTNELGYREGLALWQRQDGSPGGREFWPSRYSQTTLLQTGEPRSLVREELTGPCGLLAIFKWC